MDVCLALRCAIEGVNDPELVFQVIEFLLLHVFLQQGVKRGDVRRNIVGANLRSLLQLELSELQGDGKVALQSDARPKPTDKRFVEIEAARLKFN